MSKRKKQKKELHRHDIGKLRIICHYYDDAELCDIFGITQTSLRRIMKENDIVRREKDYIIPDED